MENGMGTRKQAELLAPAGSYESKIGRAHV